MFSTYENVRNVFIERLEATFATESQYCVCVCVCVLDAVR